MRRRPLRLHCAFNVQLPAKIAVDKARDSQVAQNRVPLCVDKNVARLYVAMDNACGMNVVKDRLQLHVPARKLRFIRLARLNVRKRARRAVRAKDEIHRKVENALLLVFSEIVHAQKVRMPEPRQRHALGAEPPPQ